MRKILLNMIFVMLFATLSVGCGSDNDKPKDHIVVLDTSMSMVGKGGRNILSQVKKSIIWYIDDKVKEGDTFTFVKYDTEVKFDPTIDIRDDRDKEIIKKYVSFANAKGMWTYNYEMLDKVGDRAEELKLKDDGRQQVIIIISDAQDDPPPGKKRRRKDISKFEKFEGKDYLFIVADVGVLKVPKKDQFAEVEKKSKYNKRIKITDKKGLSEELNRKISTSVDELDKQYQADQGFNFLPWIIAAIVTLLVLGLIWYLKKLSSIKLFGVLEYHDHTAIRPETIAIDLGRLFSRKVRIGKRADYDVTIREFDADMLLVLEAISFDGNLKVAVSSESSSIEFEKKKKESFLIDGDVFKMGDFTFTYLEEEGK